MKHSRKKIAKFFYEDYDFEYIASKALRNQTFKSAGFRTYWHRFLILIFNYIFRLCIFFLIRIRKIKSSKSIPSVFVYSLTPEQIYYNGSTNSLVSFLNEERFGRTLEKSKYLVESRRFFDIFRRESIVTPDISMHIIISCLDAARLTELLCEFNELHNFLKSNKSFKSLKTRSYFRLIIDFTLWKVLNHENGLVLITTISSSQSLPTPFYFYNPNYSRQMIWYATNWRPIQKNAGSAVPGILSKDLEFFVDLHLVWDKFEIETLREYGIVKTKDFGSMLFYPFTNTKVLPKLLTVTFFDVTPLKDSTGFYSEQMSIRNILGLVKAIAKHKESSGVEVCLQIKPKRKYLKSHSSEYITILQKLSQNGSLTQLPSDSNLYHTVGSSSLVLGTPFTSPVLIAKELGVSCAFMSLDGEDFKLPSLQNGIRVISKEAELEDILLELRI
jgi:polysaccharide biosynthesis PFTS motif protein